MGEYGFDYTRKKFCYVKQISQERIIGETVLSNSEVIYELDNGSRILYDEVGDRLIPVGCSGINYVTDEMWRNEFSRRLKKMMSMRGYYAKDLAEEIGISENAMSRYTTGKRIPSAYDIQRMANCLDCDVEYLTNFDYLL